MIPLQIFSELFHLAPTGTEFEFYFNNTEGSYMLIKYDDSVSFQRCGYSQKMIKEGWNADYLGTDELFYTSFEELYVVTTVDGLYLKNDWNKVKQICIDSLYCIPDDIDEIHKVYQIKTGK